MMGHREKFKSAAEYDVFTAWRKWYVGLKRPGVVHSVKKMVSRRYRREEKQRLSRLKDEDLRE